MDPGGMQRDSAARSRAQQGKGSTQCAQYLAGHSNLWVVQVALLDDAAQRAARHQPRHDGLPKASHHLGIHLDRQPHMVLSVSSQT